MPEKKKNHQKVKVNKILQQKSHGKWWATSFRGKTVSTILRVFNFNPNPCQTLVIKIIPKLEYVFMEK